MADDITWGAQQADALEKIHAWYKRPNDRVFKLHGYAGTGKAQPLTAQVQTPAGPRTLGNLKVGDRIFGRNGKPITVLGVFPQGVRPVYRVMFRDGSFTRCDPEHLWTLESRKAGRPEVVLTTQQMVDAGLFYGDGADKVHKFKVPLCRPVEYETPTPELDAYTLGVLLGDGYICGSTVAFSCAHGDEEIRDRVAANLPDGFTLKPGSAAKSCPQYVLKKPEGTYRNALRTALKAYRLTVKAGEKFIPQEYLTAPVQDRVELLRGLMDTDGSSRGNRICFHTTSPNLADGVVTLVQSLGGVAIKHLSDRGSKGLEWSINVKLRDICPFHLKRKARNWRPSWKNPPSRYITDISPDGYEEQVCIKVSAEDELYLTDDFIVTHNTTLLREACRIAPSVAYGAPTGKAALRMRAAGCLGASTLHSLLYELVDPNAWPLEWRLRRELGTDGVKLVGVDEGSMVDSVIGTDLEASCNKLIVLLDPFQLPPVSGPGYFVECPDAQLTDIHRQAEGNPIIQLSMDIRLGRGLRQGQFGETVVADRYDIDRKSFLGHDIVICGTNRTRHNYNNRIRAERYGWERPDQVQAGDRLVCRRNNRRKGFLNGSLWDVNEVEVSRKSQLVRLRLTSADDLGDQTLREAVVPVDYFEGTEDGLRRDYRNRYDEFAYGYALTAHSAQGSQWDSAFVADESRVFREAANRWLYTAITRAAVRVTVAQ